MSKYKLTTEEAIEYSKIAGNIINKLFTDLDNEIETTSIKDNFNPVFLFMSIGSHLAKVLISSSKEINDKNNELSHALYCGFIDMLINKGASDKKRLKRFITNNKSVGEKNNELELV